jgi:hypothetical protein
VTSQDQRIRDRLTRYTTPRSARVEAATAQAHFPRFGPATAFLLDTDAKDPNDIYASQGGYTDPRSMNHNCPLCERTLSYDLFVAHAQKCFTKWRNVKLNITRRTFAGAAPQSTTIHAAPASASAGGAE